MDPSKLLFHSLCIGLSTALLLTGCNSSSNKNKNVKFFPPAVAGPDPLYHLQWHLKNTGQTGNDGLSILAGEDINVEPVWDACGEESGCRGEGITIAVVDDGLEIAHPDLWENMSSVLEHRVYATRFGPRNGDPTPRSGHDFHGTAVAGIAAARDNNSIGVRGVAPRVDLVGYALLTAGTDSNAVDAMVFQKEQIAISINSWGNADGTGLLLPADSLWEQAIQDGLAGGRGGLGTIYLFPAGNGHEEGDNSNYDGFANYRGVVAVGAVDGHGQRTSYSELGANLWISAPGGEFCDTLAITTTDLSGSRGLNVDGMDGDLADTNYTQCMNGTSSSTPVAAGVAALVLQANPSLSWRDLRGVLAHSARMNDPSDPDWQSNGAGHMVNHQYGFGVVDAHAAVTMAQSWSHLPAEQQVYETPLKTVNLAIPDNGPAVTDTLTVVNSGIENIEWVDLRFTASDHTYSGDLELILTSPTGTVSVLAEPRFCDADCTPYEGWRFGIARLLDEPADGPWQLSVRDGQADDVGTFENWQLTIYGH